MLQSHFVKDTRQVVFNGDVESIMEVVSKPNKSPGVDVDQIVSNIRDLVNSMNCNFTFCFIIENKIMSMIV